MKTTKYSWIKLIYLYLVSAIAIVMILIASVGLIKTLLEEYVFDVKSYEEIHVMAPNYDCSYDRMMSPPVENEFGNTGAVALSKAELDDIQMQCLENSIIKAEAISDNNLKRDLINWFAMLFVAIPVYLYHWRIICRKPKND